MDLNFNFVVNLALMNIKIQSVNLNLFRNCQRKNTKGDKNENIAFKDYAKRKLVLIILNRNSDNTVERI